MLATYAVTQAALQRARDGSGPTLVEAYTYRMGAHTTTDDPTRYRLSDDVEHWKLKDPIARLEVYLRRNGLVDDGFVETVAEEANDLGHHLREGVKALPDPKPMDMFDHVYAEETEELRHQREGYAAYLETFEGAAGGLMSATQKITLAKGLNMGLRKAMEDDPKVLIMGEDVGKLGGVFRITDGLQKDFGEDRVIDSPLAESGIVGTAVGLALRGYRPVVEIQFDGFVYPAYDQIVCQVAKMHYRSKGRSKMPMVIRIPFGGGIGAVEHHSESPEAQFAHTPGLKVVACSNPIDGYWMIQQAIASDDPVIFLEPKRQYHADKADLDDSETPEPLFTSRVVRRGTDATVLAYGPTVKTAMKAAEAAATEGTSLEVIDLRTLSPLDMGPVFESVRRTGRAIITHEAHVNLGMGSEVAARIQEECFYSLEAPVLRVGGFDTPYPASRIEEDYLPDLDRVLDAVDRSLEF